MLLNFFYLSVLHYILKSCSAGVQFVGVQSSREDILALCLKTDLDRLNV